MVRQRIFSLAGGGAAAALAIVAFGGGDALGVSSGAAGFGFDSAGAELDEALLADAECASADGAESGDDACGLSALQLRASAASATVVEAGAGDIRAVPDLDEDSVASYAELKVRQEGGAQAKALEDAYRRLSASAPPPSSLAAAGSARARGQRSPQPSSSAASVPSPAMSSSSSIARSPSSASAATPGSIAGLFTYGSPGTCLTPFRNQRSSTGSFPGKRVYTQRKESILGLPIYMHDPISFLANLVGLRHAVMDTLELTDPSVGPPGFHRSSWSLTDWPPEDLAFWVKGHSIHVYVDYLRHFQKPFNQKAYEFAVLAGAVYPPQGATTDEEVTRIVALGASKVGWNLVARSKASPLMTDFSDGGELIYRDYLSLFQDNKTLDCALVTVGTHDLTQWFANFDFEESEYCGNHGVHKGFRNEVRRTMRSPEFESIMRPAMASCKELYIAGHSLGAAQAELMAECLQRAPREGEAGWEDYRWMAWTAAEEPSRLAPIA